MKAFEIARIISIHLSYENEHTMYLYLNLNSLCIDDIAADDDIVAMIYFSSCYLYTSKFVGIHSVVYNKV